MGSSLQVNVARREYSVKAWQKALCTLLGVGLFAAGFFTFAAAAAESNRNFNSLIGIFFAAAGVYTLCWGLRSRIVIDGDRVQVRGAFQERSATTSEIEGYRTVSSRNGSYKQLYLKDGRGSLTLSSSWDTDDDYTAWLQQFTDLDERDRAALLEKISSDAELGATPADRLNALSRAKSHAIAVAVLAAAAAAGLTFGNAALQLPCAIVLALAPFPIAYLSSRSPLLVAVFKSKADPRADFTLTLIIVAFGLMFRAFSINLVSNQSLLPAAVGAAVVYIIALFGAARRNTSAAGSMFLLLILGGFYGFGFALVADTVPDKSAGQVFATQVVDKHISHGRSSSYYLDLAAWGPLQQENKLKVSSLAYGETAIGDQVCLALHPGMLQAPWYGRVDCTSLPAPLAAP